MGLPFKLQQKLLSSKLKASADPQPGDSVCPTSEQYHDTAAKSRDFWQTLITDASRNLVVSNIDEQLIDLLRYVPAFPVALPHQLSTLESYSLEVECFSEWLTTTDTECDRRFKTIRHYQTLGIPEPIVYKLTNEDVQPISQVEGDVPVFLLLVFAWSYVISSRWVEALQSAGANAQLLQIGEVNAQNFWSLIQKQQWRPILTQDDKTYFAPWSLVQAGERHSDPTVPASPATSFALQMLAEFCKTSEIYEQSIIALIVVMMLPARAYRQTISIPKCCPLANICPMDFTACRLSFNRLSSCLDSCITLSCCPEGMDSLLCSVFFDPGVSCNLIGAYMTGVMEAMSTIQGNGRVILSLMTRRCPKLAPLWAAAICTHQVQDVVLKSAGGTPPMALPLASWTGIVESFIQLRYTSDFLLGGEILQAEQWRLTYLTTDERLPPDAPSPPFGKTTVSNLNVDTREHLGHDHQLLSYRMYWVLETGEKTPAQASPIHLHPTSFNFTIARLKSYDNANKGENSSQTDIHNQECISPIDNAQKGSCNATFNIFNWLRNVEGGLWPKSGSDSSSDARAVIHHRWITDEDDDLDEDEDSSEGSVSKDTDQQELDSIRIQDWLVHVEVPVEEDIVAEDSRLNTIVEDAMASVGEDVISYCC